jgi:serine O-acetyltransferase
MKKTSTGSNDEPGIPRLREAIRGDLEHMAKRKETRFPSLGGYIDVLTFPGTWAVIFFRLASTAHHKGLRPLSRFLYFINGVLFGADMHPGAIAQPGLVVPHPFGMGFGGGCRFGKRVLLMNSTGIGGAGNPKQPGQPVIGDDVILMHHSAVFGPVHIGDRSIIGARALVVDDIPPDVFVPGTPKSDTYRPLADLGLGEEAETKIGYGAPARRAALLSDEAKVASTNGKASNGHAAKVT